MLDAKLLLLFQSFYILHLSATLKSKAALLEKEAWGCFTASLVGTKTSSLWDILEDVEDVFDKIPEFEEEKGPPSRKSTWKISLPPVQILWILSSLLLLCLRFEITFPINEGSLPIQEWLPHRKVFYLCGFQCGYHTQSRVTVCTYTCKEHLNTMLGCPLVLFAITMCGLLMHG